MALPGDVYGAGETWIRLDGFTPRVCGADPGEPLDDGFGDGSPPRVRGG